MHAAEEALPRTCALLEQGRQSVLHPGAQLYVSLRNEVVADFTLGESRPGVAMQPDTLALWLSSGKPLTVIAIAQLVDGGRLTFDAPVSRHLPEFAQGGKESITLRHLLTHTAGFRGADQLPETSAGMKPSRGSAQLQRSRIGFPGPKRVINSLRAGLSWANWCADSPAVP